MAFQFDGLMRFVHVIGAVLWFGAALFFLRIISPAVRQAGPPGGAVMATIMRRGGIGARWFGPVGTVTIAAGLYLYWRGGYHSAAFANAPNAMITVGMVLGLAAWLEGMVRSMPVENRLKRLVATIPEGTAPTTDQANQMQALGAQLNRAGTIATSLLGAAIVLMAGRGIFV